MPILILFVAMCLNEVMGWKDERKKKVILAIIFVLVAWSIAVQVIGAYLYPVYGFQWGHGQMITPENQSKLWDLKDTQIGESLGRLFNSSDHGYVYQIVNGSVQVMPAP